MSSKVSRALLERGFFPNEMPPVFTSKEFGANINFLRKKKFGDSSQWTSCDVYSMPHAKMGRRQAAIVNPVPFFGLAETISNNWSLIKKLYRRTNLSFSAPVFNGSSRAISGSDFDGYRESLITRSSGCTYVLHADFSRYFPTIYTHAIEWSVHGKKACKANLKLKKNKRALHWGESLDFYVRNMQDGQTQGLPIGPDTSYVIAEIVGSAIDERFKQIYTEELVGSRLIDDYALFFQSRAHAEEARSALGIAAAEFQIALNDEKTYIEEIADVSKESWTYQLQEYKNPKDIPSQRREIIRFTAQAMALMEKTASPSVARYAIKVLVGHAIHQKNIDLAIACVLRMAIRSPGSVPLLAGFIVGYRKIGYKIERKPIGKYLSSMLSRSLELGHDKEACWFLWMAIELRIKIPDDVISKVFLSNSSAVILLARVAEMKKLCGKIKQSVLAKTLSIDDFYSSNWLLAYEGAMRGWFGWKKSDIDGSILELLAKANIHFMDIDTPSISSIRIKDGATDFMKNVPVQSSGKIHFAGFDLEGLENILEIDSSMGGYDDFEEEEEEEYENEGEFEDLDEDEDEDSLKDASDYY